MNDPMLRDKIKEILETEPLNFNWVEDITDQLMEVFYAYCELKKSVSGKPPKKTKRV